MADPRAENCKAFKLQAGQVVGIELAYVPVPTAKYELIRAELIDEPTNGIGGPTVATCVVLDKENIQTGERVYLAWPWPGMADGHGLPGNPNGQHMIINYFIPPAFGPLGLFVGDANAQPISDLIGGVGLPDKHHVSFRFVWKERSAAVVVPPNPEPEPSPTTVVVDLTETNKLLQALVLQSTARNAILTALAKHLGAPGL